MRTTPELRLKYIENDARLSDGFLSSGASTSVREVTKAFSQRNELLRYVAELTEQRDTARDWAVRLEQENAELLQRLETT